MYYLGLIHFQYISTYEPRLVSVNFSLSVGLLRNPAKTNGGFRRTNRPVWSMLLPALLYLDRVTDSSKADHI